MLIYYEYFVIIVNGIIKIIYKETFVTELAQCLLLHEVLQELNCLFVKICLLWLRKQNCLPLIMGLAVEFSVIQIFFEVRDRVLKCGRLNKGKIMNSAQRAGWRQRYHDELCLLKKYLHPVCNFKMWLVRFLTELIYNRLFLPTKFLEIAKIS